MNRAGGKGQGKVPRFLTSKVAQLGERKVENEFGEDYGKQGEGKRAPDAWFATKTLQRESLHGTHASLRGLPLLGENVLGTPSCREQGQRTVSPSSRGFGRCSRQCN